MKNEEQLMDIYIPYYRYDYDGDTYFGPCSTLELAIERLVCESCYYNSYQSACIQGHYTAGYTDAQRYKMVGNGWTVDVIAHLLKGLYA